MSARRKRNTVRGVKAAAMRIKKTNECQVDEKLGEKNERTNECQVERKYVAAEVGVPQAALGL
eukprot:241253-Pelagomonas_calceolata.AAC.1